MTNILEMTDEEIRSRFSVSDLSMRRDMIDVTSNHRPDLSWKFCDSFGHLHRWFVSGNRPAVAYDPQASYHVPTVEWIKTGTGLYDDGSEYEIGHNVCKKCKEEVIPGYTSDSTNVYIAGMVHYFIGNIKISKSEVNRLLSVLCPGEHITL